jgi:hypothetical protein
MDVYIHVFLTSALVGGEWSTSRPGRFIPGERAPRTVLDDVKKRKISPLPGLELRNLRFQPVASRYTDCAISTPDSFTIERGKKKIFQNSMS